jgi:iron complex outermembrane receptor protein
MQRKLAAFARAASTRTCLSVGLVLMGGHGLHAQSSGPDSSTPSAAPSSNLPPVVVSPPAQRASKPKPAARSQVARRRPARQAPAREAELPAPVLRAPERALGPIDGYVAQQSTTGTKTGTRILENPQSVSVVGREQIDQQGSQTVAESLRYTAGVVAGSRPGNRFDDIFIRGFGGFGFTAGYVQFLDGLKMQRGVSYAIPNIDPYGLERVEVIKGPASVLYGQSNPGGLVNMVSKRPTERAFHEVEFLFGNYDRMQAAFDMGGPIDKEGKFLYRLTGLGLNSSTSVDFTDQQRIFFAPALTWRPTSDTTITVLTHYQNDPKSFQPNYLPAQGLMPGRPGVPANPYGKLPTSFYVGDPSHDSYKREWISSGYELEHRVSNTWTVRQNLRFQHLTSEFYAIPANPGYVSSANPNAIQRAKTAVDEEFNGVVLDNQAEAKFDTGAIRHKMLFGVDYQYNDARRLLGQARGVPNLNVLNPAYYQNIPRAAFQTDQSQQSSQLGLYVQDQMKIDRLTVSLAGRHDTSDIHFDTLTLASGARSLTDQNDRKFTYRAGALYLFDSGFAPYANYATSFEPAPYMAVGNTPLLPMMGRQYEFGVKYQPPGYDALITASYFNIRQQNVVNPDPLNAGFYLQTGEVSSQGLEIEAKASLTRNWNVIASFTYVDAEVTADRLAVNVGKRPFAVPATTASAWVDYTFREGALGGFGLGGGVRYIGDSAGDPANTFFVPSVTLFDAGLHYDFGYAHPRLQGWSARVNANNLFDKEYVAACYTLSNGCFWGARRTVMGSLKYRW